MIICKISPFTFLILYVITSLTSALKSDITNFLSTRTPYRLKHNKNVTAIKYPGCIDSKVWMLARHGTRLPSAKDINGMNSTLLDLKQEILLANLYEKGHLTQDQLDALSTWRSDLDPADQKILTVEGEDEMYQMAKRLRKNFPNAIKDSYDAESFQFRYTATQRAEASANSFATGLFGKENVQTVQYQQATRVDPVLRFYKHCDRWQKEVKKNKATYKEQKTFGRSKGMKETLQTITERLGLKRTLALDEAVLMYKICGFETAWYKDMESPWCHAFDINTVQMLEYYHDLKHYWMDGYGHGLTYKQACLAVRTMFENFSKPTKQSTFFFAHSGTLLKILSHMQLYKPAEHLRADNMDTNREWKTSDIDCFASNIAFVLFKCDDGDHVLTLHQERIVKLPMCKQELCPLKELKKHFRESIENCDYKDMCKLDRIDKTEL